MSEHILFTGLTGAIGQPLAAKLLARPELCQLTAVVRSPADIEAISGALTRIQPNANLAKLKIVPGDLEEPKLGLKSAARNHLPVTGIIHSGAVTKFKAAEGQWARVNVDGTRSLLDWREANCPQSRFIHLSTLCAAGKSMGLIPEQPLQRPVGFVNGYEASKWEAEQLVQSAGGDRAIVRLATVVGSHKDGSLGRIGAFHHVLRWVYHGLLPLIPGDQQTRLDLIPTEFVTEGVCRLLDRPPADALSFHHFSRGHASIPLGELIDLCSARFAKESAAWKRGQVDAPVLASQHAFQEFRESVIASRDFLFMQVLDSVDSFLPELFFPKVFVTDSLETLFEGKLPIADWRPWMERVLDFSLRSDFGRNP